MTLKKPYSNETVAVDRDPLSLLTRVATRAPTPSPHRTLLGGARGYELFETPHHAGAPGSAHRRAREDVRQRLPPVGGTAPVTSPRWERRPRCRSARRGAVRRIERATCCAGSSRRGGRGWRGARRGRRGGVAAGATAWGRTSLWTSAQGTAGSPLRRPRSSAPARRGSSTTPRWRRSRHRARRRDHRRAARRRRRGGPGPRRAAPGAVGRGRGALPPLLRPIDRPPRRRRPARPGAVGGGRREVGR